MARTARASVGGVCYHVINRGNARKEVFHKEEDFAAFVGLMEEANERLPMRVVAWCLLGNHFHAVQGLAELGQSAAKRSRTGGVAQMYRTRRAVGDRDLAAGHGRTIGAGSKPSSARQAANHQGKVECPRYFFISLYLYPSFV